MGAVGASQLLYYIERHPAAMEKQSADVTCSSPGVVGVFCLWRITWAHFKSSHISVVVQKKTNRSAHIARRGLSIVYGSQSLIFETAWFWRICNYFGGSNIKVFSMSVDSSCPYESTRCSVCLFLEHSSYLTQYKKGLWDK